MKVLYNTYLQSFIFSIAYVYQVPQTTTVMHIESSYNLTLCLLAYLFDQEGQQNFKNSVIRLKLWKFWWYLSNALPSLLWNIPNSFLQRNIRRKYFTALWFSQKIFLVCVYCVHNIGIVHIFLVAYLIYSIYILQGWGCCIYPLRYDSLGWFHSVMLLCIFK